MVWWVDNETAPLVKPTKKPVYSREMRFFTDRIGDTPTIPQADWFNMIQSEIIGIASALGVTPDKLNDDQIGAALKSALAKVKPISEGGTGATTAASARTNLGLKSAATLDKTDIFGTSANLVATQLLVDKLQKEMNDAMPVGVIVSWDHAEAPKGWLFVRDQKFSATEYPELAKLYPSLTLNDRRGTVDRALDAGRGFDAGRVLGSYQEDAMQRIVGYFHLLSNKDKSSTAIGSIVTTGAFRDGAISSAGSPYNGVGNAIGGSNLPFGAELDSAIVTRTAHETRMKNVATNKIIKAK